VLICLTWRLCCWRTFFDEIFAFDILFDMYQKKDDQMNDELKVHDNIYIIRYI